MSNRDAIVVENLTFQYPDTETPVLKNIHFTLKEGEVLGIIGRTGSGKTTLAMCLNRLVPTVIQGNLEGTISVFGQDISQRSVADMADKVGFVFQEPENQLSQMTVEEEIAFGMGNLGISREEMKYRIQETLKQVGLEGFEKRSPLALSGGQQQRLAIASVMAMRPSIMIMDEPTSMLDPRGKNEVYDVLRKIKTYGMTGIIIDHEVERMASYCDKILVLDDGEVIMFGTPKEVFSELTLLHEMEMNAPQVTELADRLRKELQIDVGSPITVEEAVKAFQIVSIK
ncbi:ATP-binding cassette domain-containing protein [Neobacillus thermocopriae]|uniref:energy-coupling factor ABC transporter ATP-binding protein n=1 Tax=Neobacillus thermocopriae TaxID=1215031 RepID=UPI002E1AB6ED|nr:ATP-binding cassette domain-containing protein [Neobacillus thermocopriae]MED3623475.1 ATP-binding cassette domain-containing protein [Neobacillus thermocopriae]MED3715221.1 ATP-binding cassette domain-containing protein [Neobacillus thermocopriae]